MVISNQPGICFICNQKCQPDNFYHIGCERKLNMENERKAKELQLKLRGEYK